MVQVTRNLVQVVLLVALGVAIFFGISFHSVPHLPLCEFWTMPQWTPQWVLDLTDVLAADDSAFCRFGELAIWITVPATLIFTGRRRVAWVLAPNVCLAVLHAWAAHGGKWPTVGVQEGGYPISRTDWDDVRVSATQYGAFLVLALLSYEVSSRVPRAIGWIARQRPSLTLAVGRIARRGLLIAGVAVAAFATVWFLFSFTIAYQLVSIRTEALDSTRHPDDKWADVARAAGAVPEERVSPVPPVQVPPAPPPAPAPEPLSPPLVSDVDSQKKPCASDRVRADSPAADAGAAIEQCLSQRDSRAAGDLFQGLLRVGRESDAVSLVESSAHDVSLDVRDYLPQGYRQESIQLGTQVIMRLLAIVRERYANGERKYEMWLWQSELARRLAVAGDPEAAFTVLIGSPDGESEAAGAVADAFGRQGRFDRALETLNAHGNAAATYRAVKGRLCLAMVKQGQARTCEPMVDQLILVDHTKVLALMGVQLLRSGQRSEGLAKLDKAEDLAIHGSSGDRDPVDEETVTILADAGRIRSAKLIAERLNSDQRPSAYLVVLRHITGWRRAVALAAARLSDFVPGL